MNQADVEEIKSFMDERAALICSEIDSLRRSISGLSGSLESRLADFQRAMEDEFRQTRDLLESLN